MKKFTLLGSAVALSLTLVGCSKEAPAPAPVAPVEAPAPVAETPAVVSESVEVTSTPAETTTTTETTVSTPDGAVTAGEVSVEHTPLKEAAVEAQNFIKDAAEKAEVKTEAVVDEAAKALADKAVEVKEAVQKEVK